MTHLLRAIDVGTKTIFVGDVDQLPSVGPGNVFRDLINSGEVRAVKLDEIFRQEDTSKIIINADYIRKGNHRLEWRRFCFYKEDDDTKIPELGVEHFMLLERPKNS